VLVRFALRIYLASPVYSGDMPAPLAPLPTAAAIEPPAGNRVSP
jgi:hypothetical protein